MAKNMDEATWHHGHRSPRPNMVPRLEFGGLVTNAPEENILNQPKPKAHIINSPSAQSTVSWGSPLSPPYALTSKDIEVGGTVFRPCTHLKHGKNRNIQTRNPITHASYNLNKNQSVARQEIMKPKNFSHEDQKQLDEYQKKETNNKNKSPEKVLNPKNKSKYWYLDDEHKEPETPKPEPVNTEQVIDDAAKLQAKYTTQPYSGLHDVKKSAAEDDLLNKQKQEIMEQVLVDQLSRHVLSDVEQDRDPARQNPADPTSQFNTAPLRFKSRRLHETKVSTANAVTESKLKDRINFGARLITREGRDALRELFGFYFHTDQSLTLYEFRLFGKNSNKALPFIERGKYSHIVGRRKGKQYGSVDFQLGKNLTFLTINQPHIPDSLRKHSIITLRICETSSSAPSRDWDISSTDRDDGSDTAQERKDRKITSNVQSFIRNKIRDRSVSAVVGLGKLFRMIDSSGDGLLDRNELFQALETFEISLPKEDFESVWRVVDENNDGAIDYGEFMRAFIGEMNEKRKQIVRKVFKKLDPHKTGKASFLDFQKLYSAKKHPLVVSGQLKQADVEKQFFSSFSDVCSGSEVTFTEFEEYYEGLSIAITSDDDFINMMRNCWGV